MKKCDYLDRVASSLGARYYTIQGTLNLFRQVYGRNIAQIGCTPLSGMHEDAYLTKIIFNFINDNEKIQFNIFDDDVIYDSVNSSTGLARYVYQKVLRDDRYNRFTIYGTDKLAEYKERIDLLILNELKII